MKHYSICVITLGLLGLFSCQNKDIWPVKGKGSDELKTIFIGGFERINLAMDADIYYIQDSLYKVEVSAQSNIQRVIKTDVEEGTLKIHTGRTTILKHNPIRITIHSPVISGFKVSGQGHIYIEKTIHSPFLSTEVSGNGEITIFSLTTQEVRMNVSGSGAINLSGGITVRELISINGSGTIRATELRADQSRASISGSGSISLWAVETLNAQISGHGTINYKGLPVVESKISGTGKLIHLN